MSAAENKAVFLSYASQDADAARKICDALRGAGVEVWFDQSELRGGDAWDAKIRKQIKECALFVPVISANTQARREGYFRLEWRLAVERMRHMDDDLPFLVPLVIDETMDAEAFVPERFRDVQWTRLSLMNSQRGPTALAALSTQILTLLGGGSVSLARHVPALAVEKAPIRQRRRGPAQVAIFGIVALLVVAGAVAWWTHGRRATPGPKSEVADLVRRAWHQMNLPSMADRPALTLAGEWCSRATSLEPDNADAWAAAAQVDTWIVYHNYDPTPARRALAHEKAKRALQIAPQSFEARLAQGCYVARAAAPPLSETLAASAEHTLRGLLVEKAEEPRTLFALAMLLQRMARYDEAADLFERMARHPDFTSLAYNEKGWMFLLMRNPRFAEALEAADRSVALQPTWANLSLKAMLSQSWLGDLDTAVAALERVPAAALSEDFVAAVAWDMHAWRRDPAAMLRAMAALPGDWVRASPYEGPKGFLTGVAHAMAGNHVAAEAAWRAGLKLVEDKLGAEPDRTALLIVKGELLARLGNPTEANRAFELARQIATNPLRVERYATIYGGRDAEKALAHLERGMASGALAYTAAALRLNPDFDWLRGEPGFAVLQGKADADARLSPKAAEKTSPSTAVDTKSIAVLAFRQQSADPENEYLCEAISDELCNALGRVPGLKVAASASAFSFKGKRVRPAEMAAQLGVTYLVDGRVQKIGSRVRVGAELIKAADESVVWKSDTLDYETKDMFAVQDQVVAAIAKNLQLQLGGPPAAPLTINPEAFRLYYEGRRAWTMRGEDEYVAQAAEFFRRAIAADAKLGRAYAGLADTLLVKAALTFADRNSDRTREMHALMETALRLEPESAEAYTTRGTLSWHAWRFREAEQDLRTAIRLNPSYAHAHLVLGRLLDADGRKGEALAALKMACELDPLSSRIFDNYSSALREAGRYTEALAQAERAVALQPNNSQALRTKMQALSQLGRHEEAITLAAGPAALSLPGVPGVTVLARAGKRVEAEKHFETANIRSVQQFAALGRYDEGLNVLNAEQTRVITVTGIYHNAALDPIRQDPRMVRYLTTLGLKEAHDRAQAWRAANPPEKPAAGKK